MDLGEAGHWESGTVLALALVSGTDCGWCRGVVGRRILAKMVLGMRARMGLVLQVRHTMVGVTGAEVRNWLPRKGKGCKFKDGRRATEAGICKRTTQSIRRLRCVVARAY
jgi:hypothetical protein